MLDVRPTMLRLVEEAVGRLGEHCPQAEIEHMRGYFVTLAINDLPEGAYPFFTFKLEDKDYKVFVRRDSL